MVCYGALPLARLHSRLDPIDALDAFWRLHTFDRIYLMFPTVIWPFTVRVVPYAVPATAWCPLPSFIITLPLGDSNVSYSKTLMISSVPFVPCALAFS